MLGFRIDSNTTIDQAQKALAKYNFDLSEEYTSGDFTVYDPVNQARLLEVRMNFIPASRKIEYIDIKLFPARAAVKQVIEYKGGQMYLGGILLDTAANKALQLKKLLGPATFVFDVRYSTAGGITYNARRHHYIYIAGLSFVENPFNQSLLMLQIDFLTTRAKHDLGNPLFDLVINKKKFDPENAVPNGPDNVKSHYGLDSVSKQVVESDNKTYVSSTSKYGKLEFEFAGKYNFERRVHFVNYYLNTVRSQAETDAEPATKPAVVVREGLMSMTNNKGSFSWDSSLPPTEALKTIIGEPDITTATGVSEYNRQGIRLWTKDGKIYSIQFYLDNYINAYSGNNDSPGLFTGSIQVDGRSLTTSSTVEYAKQALTSYNLQKAYDDKNHTVYRGTYKGTTLYLTFLLSGKRLISVSVNK